MNDKKNISAASKNAMRHSIIAINVEMKLDTSKSDKNDARSDIAAIAATPVGYSSPPKSAKTMRGTRKTSTSSNAPNAMILSRLSRSCKARSQVLLGQRSLKWVRKEAERESRKLIETGGEEDKHSNPG